MSYLLAWIEGLEIRYLEPMKIWRVVTQSQIKGEIFLWNIGNKSKNSVVWGILQKKTMKQTEFEVQDILP